MKINSIKINSIKIKKEMSPVEGICAGRERDSSWAALPSCDERRCDSAARLIRARPKTALHRSGPFL